MFLTKAGQRESEDTVSGCGTTPACAVSGTSAAPRGEQERLGVRTGSARQLGTTPKDSEGAVCPTLPHGDTHKTQGQHLKNLQSP